LRGCAYPLWPGCETLPRVTEWTFQPPPGWPEPPAGWSPPPGWQPDPAWPTAPPGWQFWRRVPAAGPPPAPDDARPSPSLPGRRVLIRELLVVGAVFPLPFIASAVIVLAQAAAGLRGTRLPALLPGNPVGSAVLLTLTTAAQLAPAVLVWYLLGRSGETMRDIGLDRCQPGRDLLRGAGLAVAAFIASGAVAVLIKNAAPGVSYGVRPTGQPGLIYLLPGLVTAVWAAIVEEIVVAGYLLHRLDQLRVSKDRALLISTAVRTSYHLYYGLSALAIIPFGLILGRMWQRNKRLGPLIAAHAIYDGVLIAISIAAGS
jgi:membrane protease YdiL (CAAX protease family)